jgi:hypothetical protein
MLAAIAKATGPVCDDCLSVRAEVTPPQQVFAICTRLAASRAIVREQTTCASCGKTKKSSRPHDTQAAGTQPRTGQGAARATPHVVRSIVLEPPPANGAMAESSGDTGTRPWHWEGHVQDMLRRHLVAGGWTVKSAANTESREPGIDLVATKDGRWLAIEVKGYPTNVYDHGAKRGQPKPTQPTNQARQWFSHALLAAMLLRHKRPDAEIALCFPDFQTYRTLASRTRRSFVLLGFGIYFVAKDGKVRADLPHQPVAP